MLNYFFEKNILDMFNTVTSLEKSLDPYLDTKKNFTKNR